MPAMRVPARNLWGLLLCLLPLAVLLPLRPLAAQPAGGSVCVLAYADENSNGIRDSNDTRLLADVIFYLRDNQGVVVAAYRSDGVSEPHCFAGLPAGDYSMTFNSAAYEATDSSVMNFTVEATQAAPLNSFFGGRSLLENPAAASIPDASQTLLTRLLLALAGSALTIIFMAALGLIIYRVRFR